MIRNRRVRYLPFCAQGFQSKKLQPGIRGLRVAKAVCCKCSDGFFCMSVQSQKGSANCQNLPDEKLMFRRSAFVRNVKFLISKVPAVPSPFWFSTHRSTMPTEHPIVLHDRMSVRSSCVCFSIFLSACQHGRLAVSFFIPFLFLFLFISLTVSS